MPETWQKLLTKSAITREDYAKDPQAVLDVLEFYTDHQKREMEELGLYPNSRPGTSGNGLSPSTLSPYSQTSSAPRFNAGTGLGGIGKTSLDSRPQIRRQDSAPGVMNTDPDQRGGTQTTLPQNLALARAAELVNGAHIQHATISGNNASGIRPPLPQLSPTISPTTSGTNNLQTNRLAPSRPLLTANRPAPPTPGQKSPLQDYTPSSADLRARTKAQGPSVDHSPKPPGLGVESPPVRKESLNERDRERELRERDKERERDLEREQREDKRPQITPSKSSPATPNLATSPVLGPAGSVTGPPPIKPLQPVKKITAPAVTVTQPEEDGGVEAAAAALEKQVEKPKEKEKRISTMTEAQIMEKLRTVVSQDDPKLLYSKIRKVGQGYALLHSGP